MRRIGRAAGGWQVCSRSSSRRNTAAGRVGCSPRGGSRRMTAGSCAAINTWQALRRSRLHCVDTLHPAGWHNAGLQELSVANIQLDQCVISAMHRRPVVCGSGWSLPVTASARKSFSDCCRPICSKICWSAAGSPPVPMLKRASRALPSAQSLAAVCWEDATGTAPQRLAKLQQAGWLCGRSL